MYLSALKLLWHCPSNRQLNVLEQIENNKPEYKA